MSYALYVCYFTTFNRRVLTGITRGMPGKKLRRTGALRRTDGAKRGYPFLYGVQEDLSKKFRNLGEAI